LPNTCRNPWPPVSQPSPGPVRLTVYRTAALARKLHLPLPDFPAIPELVTSAHRCRRGQRRIRRTTRRPSTDPGPGHPYTPASHRSLGHWSEQEKAARRVKLGGGDDRGAGEQHHSHREFLCAEQPGHQLPRVRCRSATLTVSATTSAPSRTTRRLVSSVARSQTSSEVARQEPRAQLPTRSVRSAPCRRLQSIRAIPRVNAGRSWATAASHAQPLSGLLNCPISPLGRRPARAGR
jgi:hypothetical protein